MNQAVTRIKWDEASTRTTLCFLSVSIYSQTRKVYRVSEMPMDDKIE